MSPEIDEAADEAAEKAQCQRCKTVILSESSRVGLVFGRLYVPMVQAECSYQLCGKCGLLLREFLFPEILSDPVYLGAKRELIAGFWT